MRASRLSERARSTGCASAGSEASSRRRLLVGGRAIVFGQLAGLHDAGAPVVERRGRRPAAASAASAAAHKPASRTRPDRPPAIDLPPVFAVSATGRPPAPPTRPQSCTLRLVPIWRSLTHAFSGRVSTPKYERRRVPQQVAAVERPGHAIGDAPAQRRVEPAVGARVGLERAQADDARRAAGEPAAPVPRQPRRPVAVLVHGRSGSRSGATGSASARWLAARGRRCCCRHRWSWPAAPGRASAPGRKSRKRW